MTPSHCAPGQLGRGTSGTGRVKRQSPAKPVQRAAVEPRKAVPQPSSFLLCELWTLHNLPVGEAELGPVFYELQDYCLTQDRQEGKGAQGAVWRYTWLTSTV
eukprot:2752597-Rhodomonas_salina.1